MPFTAESSKRYLEALQRMKDIHAQLTVLNTPGEDGKLPAMSMQTITDLRVLYAQALEAVDAFLNGLKPEDWNGVNRGPESEQVDNAYRMQQFVLRDLERLQNAVPGMDYPTAITKADMRAVDITGHQFGVVGGAQSSRMPMAVAGQDGSYTPGFFTVSQPVTRRNAVTEAAKRAMNGQPEALAGKMQAYLDQMLQCDDVGELTPDWVENWLLLRLQRDNTVPQEEKQPLMAFLSDCSNAVRNAEQFVLDMEDTTNTPLAVRNVGMTKVADLLGVPDLLARATPMKVVNKGVSTEGVFMEKAKGEDIAHLTPDSDLLKAGPDAMDNSPVLRQLTDLSVLDFICGNTDRHRANIFYQTDANGKIIGIQGIDNDNSFGMRADIVGSLNHDGLRAINVISASMAQRLRTLTDDMLRQAVLDAGMTAQHAEAAVQRMNAVKTKLAERKITVIPNKDFEKYTLADLAKRNTPKGREKVYCPLTVAAEALTDLPQLRQELANAPQPPAPRQEPPHVNLYVGADRASALQNLQPLLQLQQTLKQADRWVFRSSPEYAKVMEMLEGTVNRYRKLEQRPQNPGRLWLSQLNGDFERVQKACEAYLQRQVTRGALTADGAETRKMGNKTRRRVDAVRQALTMAKNVRFTNNLLISDIVLDRPPDVSVHKKDLLEYSLKDLGQELKNFTDALLNGDNTLVRQNANRTTALMEVVTEKGYTAAQLGIDPKYINLAPLRSRLQMTAGMEHTRLMGDRADTAAAQQSLQQAGEFAAQLGQQAHSIGYTQQELDALTAKTGMDAKALLEARAREEKRLDDAKKQAEAAKKELHGDKLPDVPTYPDDTPAKSRLRSTLRSIRVARTEGTRRMQLYGAPVPDEKAEVKNESEHVLRTLGTDNGAHTTDFHPGPNTQKLLGESKVSYPALVMLSFFSDEVSLHENQLDTLGEAAFVLPGHSAFLRINTIGGHLDDLIHARADINRDAALIHVGRTRTKAIMEAYEQGDKKPLIEMMKSCLPGLVESGMHMDSAGLPSGPRMTKLNLLAELKQLAERDPDLKAQVLDALPQPVKDGLNIAMAIREISQNALDAAALLAQPGSLPPHKLHQAAADIALYSHTMQVHDNYSKRDNDANERRAEELMKQRPDLPFIKLVSVTAMHSNMPDNPAAAELKQLADPARLAVLRARLRSEAAIETVFSEEDYQQKLIDDTLTGKLSDRLPGMKQIVADVMTYDQTQLQGTGLTLEDGVTLSSRFNMTLKTLKELAVKKTAEEGHEVTPKELLTRLEENRQKFIDAEDASYAAGKRELPPLPPKAEAPEDSTPLQQLQNTAANVPQLMQKAHDSLKAVFAPQPDRTTLLPKSLRDFQDCTTPNSEFVLGTGSDAVKVLGLNDENVAALCVLGGMSDEVAATLSADAAPEAETMGYDLMKVKRASVAGHFLDDIITARPGLMRGRSIVEPARLKVKEAILSYNYGNKEPLAKLIGQNLQHFAANSLDANDQYGMFSPVKAVYGEMSATYLNMLQKDPQLLQAAQKHGLTNDTIEMLQASKLAGETLTRAQEARSLLAADKPLTAEQLRGVTADLVTATVMNRIMQSYAQHRNQVIEGVQEQLMQQGEAGLQKIAEVVPTVNRALQPNSLRDKGMGDMQKLANSDFLNEVRESVYQNPALKEMAKHPQMLQKYLVNAQAGNDFGVKYDAMLDQFAADTEKLCTMKPEQLTHRREVRQLTRGLNAVLEGSPLLTEGLQVQPKTPQFAEQVVKPLVQLADKSAHRQQLLELLAGGEPTAHAQLVMKPLLQKLVKQNPALNKQAENTLSQSTIGPEPPKRKPTLGPGSH